MSDSTSLKERIRKVSQLFKEHLPSRLEEIHKSWHYLKHVEWNASEVDKLTRTVHKLAGSAGTLGYVTISKYAKELDELLIDIASDSSLSPNDQRVNSIQVLLQKLKPDQAESLLASYDTGVLTNKSVENDVSLANNLIYLVDDDPVILSVLGAQLKASGYRVKEFPALDAFYSELQVETPSLLILDIGFPQGPLAGIEALQTLKIKTGVQIPVIFISSRSDMVARLSALRAGGNAFFTKPVDIAPLLKICAGMLSKGEEKYRALLVDDDKVCQLTHSHFLNAANFQTETVSDPLNVLMAIHEFRPDVLILDLKMPNCDGFEVANILRQEKEFKFLPILFLSATENEDDMERMSSMENCEFLQKPVEKDKLVQVSLRLSREYTFLKNKLLELKSTDESTKVCSKYELFERLDEQLLKARESGDASNPGFFLIYLVLDKLNEMRQQANLRESNIVNEKIYAVLEGQLGSHDSISAESDGVILILKHASIANITAGATKFLDALGETDLDFAGNRYSLRASAGIVPVLGSLRGVFDTLNYAEKAAAVAFEQGGNRCEIVQINALDANRHETSGDNVKGEKAKAVREARPPLPHKKFDRDQEIKEALLTNQFFLKFQPIVHIAQPDFDAFEALLFLRGNNGAEYSATQFLPLLGEQDYKKIDRKLSLAAIETMGHDTNARNSAMLFLNVTRATIKETVLIPVINSSLQGARIKGGNRIVFMLNQDDVLNNLEYAITFSQKARAIKCMVGVDHACLKKTDTYMSRLLPDFIRLSPSVVENAAKNDKEKDALRAFTKDLEGKRVQVMLGSLNNMVDMQLFYKCGIKLFQGDAIQTPSEGLVRQFGFESKEHSESDYRSF